MHVVDTNHVAKFTVWYMELVTRFSPVSAVGDWTQVRSRRVSTFARHRAGTLPATPESWTSATVRSLSSSVLVRLLATPDVARPFGSGIAGALDIQSFTQDDVCAA